MQKWEYCALHQTHSTDTVEPGYGWFLTAPIGKDMGIPSEFVTAPDNWFEMWNYVAELGRQGWEMFQVSPNLWNYEPLPDSYVVWFKRPIED